MTAVALEPRYRAQIEGDVYGQVAVGTNVIQIGHVSGGKVEIYQGGPPRRRPRPQERPRPFPNLLGREQEVALITGTLEAAETVEVFGRPGIGKTSLMQHVAHIVPPLADGVIHRAPGRRPLEDVLQLLFDAFYTSSTPVKRRIGELVSDLSGIAALVYLDDLDLSREDVGRLLDVLRASTVMLASPERLVWGGGNSLRLRGLPPAVALALLEQELGRGLDEAEREPAQALVQALDGHPLDILRAAARAREEGLSLAQLAQELRTDRPAQALAGQLISALSGREKQIVAALATVEGVPLHEEHLQAIATPLAAALRELEASGVAESHSPEYSLRQDLGSMLPADWLPPWREWLLNHFVRWVTAHRSEPELLLRDAPAIVRILEWAMAQGRWPEALTLIQALEPALALDRQWATSGRLLDWALQAARASGATAAEAWALHQQGTYALGLGEQDVARQTLQQALQIRERLGDELGAALTRHNLGFLLGPPPSPPQQGPEPGPNGRPSLWRPLLLGAGLLAVVGMLIVGVLFVIANRERPDDRPQIVPPAETDEPPPEELPDLVVTDWRAAGEPFQSRVAPAALANFPDVFLVPVELVIQNEGGADAGPFFVSVHSVRGPCDPTLPFLVEGQEETPFPEITGGLPAGESVTIGGVVGLIGAGPESTCALVATVDSSEPGPDRPGNGRVRELDEDNNRSAPLAVTTGRVDRGSVPVVDIQSPEDGAFFQYSEFDEEANRWFAVVPLFAAAFDEEDGELPAEAMRWETNREDLQNPFLGQGNGFEVRLYGAEDLCDAEFHEIVVTVIDSDGNEAQAFVTVGLRTICID